MTEVAGRLQMIASESTPLSDDEKESLLTGLTLGDDKRVLQHLTDSTDVLWSGGRRVLLLWLMNKNDEAFAATEEVDGFWKHYLRFQLLLPEWAKARLHLDQAISESYRATFCLNDLAEIYLYVRSYSRALETRRSFLKRNPPAKSYWNQVVRMDARAHGTRSQFAYWTALTGLAEITPTGRSASATVQRLRGYELEDWVDLLKHSERVQLSNPKWRFLFHRALWGLRHAGEWDIPKRFLFRRLLKASYTDDGRSPLVPALSVL